MKCIVWWIELICTQITCSFLTSGYSFFCSLLNFHRFLYTDLKLFHISATIFCFKLEK